MHIPGQNVRMQMSEHMKFNRFGCSLKRIVIIQQQLGGQCYYWFIVINLRETVRQYWQLMKEEETETTVRSGSSHLKVFQVYVRIEVATKMRARVTAPSTHSPPHWNVSWEPTGKGFVKWQSNGADLIRANITTIHLFVSANLHMVSVNIGGHGIRLPIHTDGCNESMITDYSCSMLDGMRGNGSIKCVRCGALPTDAGLQWWPQESSLMHLSNKQLPVLCVTICSAIHDVCSIFRRWLECKLVSADYKPGKKQH